jgi:hypothetical protein
MTPLQRWRGLSEMSVHHQFQKSDGVQPLREGSRGAGVNQQASSRLTVAAFTGGRTASSARFRVRQLIPELRELSIEVDEYIARLPPMAVDAESDMSSDTSNGALSSHDIQ